MRHVPLFAAALLLAACESSHPAHPEMDAAAASVTCPVSGEMARPEVSIVHDGRTVSFCCEDCMQAFRENPAKFTVNASAKPDGAHRVEGSAAK